ncbi:MULTISPECIES: transcription factor FapR [Thermoactinomyces]|jgi:acyl-coenzyme A thioesterase PaaI-like protein|uniref:Transcription factor FapR n=1 Tax=Thermoactinomyces vulgaris TaxID=2026 RepID=A0ABS0QHM6_THEVU|nr:MULTISPECIES: transcription factor FapR [Thermoactinomyces]KFZ40580.1 fatty acid biosynthesis transcriptional regulator [Thermoactinomyces sp. Gus2-1]KYQ87018.1 fatty acid biosynthesis transcriptional regulator [Thermoactinomyces sp. AS95]MBA4551600.1 transcription factor FapR [Thermoactinomyces vulgaris]MBA4596521.1 transcription factor FapR [Thermoactinomyces vulgaris]MBH8582748.1 transcription factor FapR [Thermoactinomyces sp. CICC 10735]
MRLSKKERQQQVIRAFEDEPFLTDEECAKRFGVSIQTIRLDRWELGIPELRERIKHMAENHLDRVRSLSLDEVIGDVVDLQLDHSGVSILEIKKEYVFARNHIARGHILFAQANSLAIAVANAEVALTGAAGIRFVRPVYLGEKCIAKAKVVKKLSSRLQVDVLTKVNGETVFQGTFDVYCLEDKELVKEEL